LTVFCTEKEGTSIRIAIATLAMLVTLTANAKTEADHQAQWCPGKKEVELKDLTRVDCLTDTHAIEIEWAHNWKEAIGQSLHYALMTGKAPGITLIYKKPSDKRYRDQLRAVLDANRLEINIWVIE